MLDIAGVPPQKFRPICSAIDKLDKEPWEAVRAGRVLMRLCAVEPFSRLLLIHSAARFVCCCADG